MVLRALIAATATAAILAPAATAAPPLVIVLAGQSNMVGYARPIQPQPLDPRINRVNTDGTLTPVADPVFEYDPAAGAPGSGPGYWFARSYLTAHPAATVGLVPCAYSGTRIAEWQPGMPLFESCVARTQAALDRGGKLGGILFFQGESDANTQEIAAAWPTGFDSFVAGIRARLRSPRAPVVFARIATIPVTPAWAPYAANWAAIRDAQTAVRIPGVAMVSTDGLAYGVDTVSQGHFGPAEVRVIGGRFAAAFAALTKPRVGRLPRYVAALMVRGAALNALYRLG